MKILSNRFEVLLGMLTYEIKYYMNVIMTFGLKIHVDFPLKKTNEKITHMESWKHPRNFLRGTFAKIITFFCLSIILMNSPFQFHKKKMLKFKLYSYTF